MNMKKPWWMNERIVYNCTCISTLACSTLTTSATKIYWADKEDKTPHASFILAFSWSPLPCEFHTPPSHL